MDCKAIQASLSFTISCSGRWSLAPWSLFKLISWSLFKLISIESVMPLNHLILCCSRFLLPSIFPSIRVFSGESVLGFQGNLWLFSWRKVNTQILRGLLNTDSELLLTFGDLKQKMEFRLKSDLQWVPWACSPIWWPFFLSLSM